MNVETVMATLRQHSGLSIFWLTLLLAGLINFVGCGNGRANSESISKERDLNESTSYSTIRIAQWNVLNLGKDTPVYERAQVLATYDIIGLTEVEHEIGLENLEKQLEDVMPGVDWKVVRTGNAVGEGGAAEYYSFIYRSDRITEVTGGQKGLYQESSPEEFSREPFYATFKAGNFDFTLILFHATFGNGGSDISREIKELDHVYNQVQGLS
jgi:hypothetical protein